MEPPINPRDEAIELLLKSLVRQIRAVKIFLGVFFVLILASLAILGFVAYKVITFTQQINTKINNLETKASQTLDVKSDLCNSSVSSLLQGKSELCK